MGQNYGRERLSARVFSTRCTVVRYASSLVPHDRLNRNFVQVPRMSSRTSSGRAQELFKDKDINQETHLAIPIAKFRSFSKTVRRFARASSLEILERSVARTFGRPSAANRLTVVGRIREQQVVATRRD